MTNFLTGIEGRVKQIQDQCKFIVRAIDNPEFKVAILIEACQDLTQMSDKLKKCLIRQRDES